MMQNLKRNWLVISKLTWWIWRVLNPACESLKIFNLMCSFWAKYIYFQAEKVQRSYLSRNWRGIQHSERNRLVVSKLAWGIWQNLTWVLESLKDFHFNGLLWARYILFELKIYRGVIFHDTDKWWKIWRKIDLLLGKWHEEFGKF